MFRLKLASAPNPDYDERFVPAPTRYIAVSSLERASQKCTAYIKKFNLGAGNWVGGQVTLNRKRIAEISYNGKVWKTKLSKHA